MDIHIFDQGRQTGPFTLDAVREMQRRGALSAAAMVWHADLPDWAPMAPFLEEHDPAPAPAAPVFTQPSSGNVPTAQAVLGRAALAGLAVAVVAGSGWAVMQSVLRIQLAWLVGATLAWLCAQTVAKVSRGSTGPVYLAVAFGCVTLLWTIGVFGVAAFGLAPAIGVGTISAYLFSLFLAWKALFV